jgi:hypothetical protein
MHRATWGCLVAVAACGGQVSGTPGVGIASVDAGAEASVASPSIADGSLGPLPDGDVMSVAPDGAPFDGPAGKPAGADAAREASSQEVDATTTQKDAAIGAKDATDAQDQDGDATVVPNPDGSTSDSPNPICPDVINPPGPLGQGECVGTDLGWNAWSYVPTATFTLGHIAVDDCNVLPDGSEDTVELLDGIPAEGDSIVPGPVLATGVFDGSGDVTAWAALQPAVIVTAGHVYFVATTAATGTAIGAPASTLFNAASVGGPWQGAEAYPWTAYLCE